MTIQNEAKASYIGIGRKQIVEQTFWQIPWWRHIDPLAQTFLLTDERYITSIDLFFATRDDEEDLTVQIRQVSNGYPSMNVMTSRVLKGWEVKTSNNGTVPTRVTFPDPVLLQANVEYAIVILTTSANYRAYVARMGNKDLTTQKIVSRQPYDIGLLFSSSNGSAWTAHQDMDLKFKLYGAKFAGKSELYFNKISVNKMTHLILAASQVVPQRSDIRWEYSLDSITWYPLAGQDVTQLVQVATDVYIRALMRSEEVGGVKGSSPVLQKQVNAVAMKYKNDGMYVSRLITSEENFSDIAIYLDMSSPSGTTQFVEYTVDNGKNWRSSGSASPQGKIDEEFMRVKFQIRLDTPAKSFRVRIKLSSSEPMLTPRARNLMVHTS
ncbi:hypothetical protein EDM56_11955 [Brevibacillus fluminis]|uniref:Uncharacterized protein n=1 Tax=Brevibacillus fluminis TaxID=511487 RepID=A0A3M8DQZ5_9BACL|nr:hypothetical protein [Brevibacillus fluminis]RNB89865.1 hypothetical protein EDM56_11955 [Brevibacillus fluminis]